MEHTGKFEILQNVTVVQGGLLGSKHWIIKTDTFESENDSAVMFRLDPRDNCMWRWCGIKGWISKTMLAADENGNKWKCNVFRYLKALRHDAEVKLLAAVPMQDSSDMVSATLMDRSRNKKLDDLDGIIAVPIPAFDYAVDGGKTLHREACVIKMAPSRARKDSALLMELTRENLVLLWALLQCNEQWSAASSNDQDDGEPELAGFTMADELPLQTPCKRAREETPNISDERKVRLEEVLLQHGGAHKLTWVWKPTSMVRCYYKANACTKALHRRVRLTNPEHIETDMQNVAWVCKTIIRAAEAKSVAASEAESVAESGTVDQHADGD